MGQLYRSRNAQFGESFLKGAFSGAAAPVVFIVAGAALDRTGMFHENLMMGAAHISLLFHLLSAKQAFENKKSEIHIPSVFKSHIKSNGMQHFDGRSAQYDKIYFDRKGRMAGAAVALFGHITFLANLPK